MQNFSLVFSAILSSGHHWWFTDLDGVAWLYIFGQKNRDTASAALRSDERIEGLTGMPINYIGVEPGYDASKSKLMG